MFTNIRIVLLLFVINTLLSAGFIDETYNNIKIYKNDLMTMGSAKEEQISMEKEDKEFVEKKWDDLFKKISDAQNTYSDLEKAPASALFGADKKSLRNDLDEELSDILFMITKDKSALKYIKIIRQINKKIQDEKHEITSNNEKLLLSNDESKKEKYQISIEQSQKNITHYEANIVLVEQSLLFNLESAGVTFTPEQLRVLLSRVDVDDTLGLILVYNNLKIVTEQLGAFMQTTTNDVQATKKYYAMFVILSEMVVYVQKQYITKMDTIYLPKITQVIQEAKNIQSNTQMLINATNTKSTQETLKNNIKYQISSFKVANEYQKQLIQQRLQIANALKQSLLDLKVALNTFKTVEISYDLLDIMKQNSKSFDSLLHLQLPTIIPFNNQAMQIEYNKITEKILVE